MNRFVRWFVINKMSFANEGCVDMSVTYYNDKYTTSNGRWKSSCCAQLAPLPTMGADAIGCYAMESDAVICDNLGGLPSIHAAQ